jgi:hypothetical protein
MRWRSGNIVVSLLKIKRGALSRRCTPHRSFLLRISCELLASFMIFSNKTSALGKAFSRNSMLWLFDVGLVLTALDFSFERTFMILTGRPLFILCATQTNTRLCGTLGMVFAIDRVARYVNASLFLLFLKRSERPREFWPSFSSHVLCYIPMASYVEWQLTFISRAMKGLAQLNPKQTGIVQLNETSYRIEL